MAKSKIVSAVGARRSDSWSFQYAGGNFDGNWTVSFGPPGYVMSTALKTGANVFTWTEDGKYYRLTFKKGGKMLIGSNNLVLLGRPHRIVRLLTRNVKK
ncbi:hypothetical protein SAMN05444162_2448 [Paenibacillaceae bacterium GAS479]|nr:hypothetical protein SAMN05444162_2448 [Paenibacillaceae bacterium GAS479]